MANSTTESGRTGGLVLTRKVGQSVSIENGLIEIEVVRIKGHQVRLRFRGNAKIDRKERLEGEDVERYSP